MPFTRLTDDVLMDGWAFVHSLPVEAVYEPDFPDLGEPPERRRRLLLVPGAVQACLNLAVTEPEELVATVSRITRSTPATVRAVLAALAGSDPKRAFWLLEEGHYVPLVCGPTAPAAGAPILLAA